jgi:hypothetical protein
VFMDQNQRSRKSNHQGLLFHTDYPNY